ncbi:MAG TPA: hypothetical protein VLD58_11790 [Gemmatimonadales bacterium]|nr:hypothetical protein [Gemmatimonadales bacterium]
MTGQDDLDRELREIGFAPRASLGAEIRGRAARGEEPRRFAPQQRRPAILAAAATVVLGLVSFAGWQTSRQRLVAVDHCCQDLDGGGTADDGVLIVSQAGVKVQDLRIYEDVDRSGGYSPGDPVRFLRGGAPAVAGPVDGGETREFCCLDYDGGGPSDDALVVVGRAPDLITMAAIYERTAPGAQAKLR